MHNSRCFETLFYFMVINRSIKRCLSVFRNTLGVTQTTHKRVELMYAGGDYRV